MHTNEVPWELHVFHMKRPHMPGTPIITICIAHINLAYLTTLFGHVSQFYDHEICHLYPVYSNKLIIVGHYSYIQAALGNLSGVILPTLCVWITIHPENIRRKHCSSHDYFMKLLLLAALSLKIPTLFIIFLLFKLALFIICTDISFIFFLSLFQQ